MTVDQIALWVGIASGIVTVVAFVISLSEKRMEKLKVLALLSFVVACCCVSWWALSSSIQGSKSGNAQARPNGGIGGDDSKAAPKDSKPATDVSGLCYDADKDEVVFPAGQTWAVRVTQGRGWPGGGNTRLKAIEVEGEREKMPADAGDEVMIFTLTSSGGSPATKEQKVKYRDLPPK